MYQGFEQGVGGVISINSVTPSSIIMDVLAGFVYMVAER